LGGEKNTTLMASANDDGNRNNTMIVNVRHDEILGRDTVTTPLDVDSDNQEDLKREAQVRLSK
jgi:hypothetical protein